MIGESATRIAAEVATVGCIPLKAPIIPDLDFDEKPVEEARGEDSVLGDQTIRRYGKKWDWSPTIVMYTESGITKGMMGTIFKHHFGKVTSAQNASTGQYLHMLYPTKIPFNVANLGTKALTANINHNEGEVMKNWPHVGGRVKKINLVQAVSSQLEIPTDFFGQFKTTTTAEIGSPVFPAENLRLDSHHLKIYTGATRVGTGPDYTDFTFGGADQIRPYSAEITLTSPYMDEMKLTGTDYAEDTEFDTKWQVEGSFVVDYNDPASGFSSVDQFNNWLSAVTEIPLLFHWDTGVIAGTGDNHSLYIDIPRAVLKKPKIEKDRVKGARVTIAFTGLYDATTTKYPVGMLLKNTAVTI